MDPITIALGLAQFAPVIAGWFGGPKAADVAAKVVGVAETVTGQKGSAAVACLQADPALALQFQTKVLEQQSEFAQIAADEYKETLAANVTEGQTAAADRDSARKMQIAQPSSVPALLSGLLTLGVVGIVAVLFAMHARGIDLPDDQLTMLIIGSVLTQWSACMGYWFGTTRQMHNLQNSLAQSAPAEVLK